ncbi:alpha-L-fucosidase [Niabella yanshanensis]|uniref:alpha-L-fucosidase n=1 Tax=Niabella yanshanensis TaxID=577386 RepID=A0ABZ0W606_9BACT|nr:alpha-L-fucosidase [Niabella yanshanensis]WQD38364.1 alpha-L-fucosidase [Niabella yanshanensis]
MKRRDLIKGLAMASPALLLADPVKAGSLLNFNEKIAKGPFQPGWDSLSAYKVPAWFQNAKFGIWAHWGPQCEPESGDWYARGMYVEGSARYNTHLKKYGHPSQFGFKDIINIWKADQWDPEELLALYKKAGAQYFMALANHHDNFDLYKSRYQPNWNSTRLGPKKDLIAGWEKAARRQGLYFGVSVHAAHAWSWYEPSQQADKAGPYAGVPYDGTLTQKDGKGKWWEGLDPQELYAQQHPLSANSDDERTIHQQWNWGNGVTPPSKKYCDQFFNRTIDLINSYDPDLVYFDDTALPLWPASDVGLKIAAHFYNKSIQKNGTVEAVIFGKILDELQRKCLVWDIERGQSNAIEGLPWQTCTCIGSWHYNRDMYEKKKYKTAKTVIHTLADVVSKNGNLLLSVPVRGNGSIDDIERGVVEEIGQWMSMYGEAIYDTRPWRIYGEGPAMQEAIPLSGQGFNEGKGKPFTAADIRFTAKGDDLYAIVMGWPETNNLSIKSLKKGSEYLKKELSQITLVGSRGAALKFSVDEEGLQVQLPGEAPALPYAFVLKVV